MNLPILPPQDLDAEMSVLGAVFLSQVSLATISEEGVKPEDFYRKGHGVIYATMLKLEAMGETVDLLTVRNRLEHESQLEVVGGRATLELLSGAVPGVSGIRTYARIVRDKSMWRRRLAAAYAQVAASTDEDEVAHSKGLAEADHAEAVAVSTWVDPARDFVVWYEDESTKGWATPFPVLTQAIGGGLVPGDVTVIGGWPGHGKTILADQFVLAAHAVGARCHIYFNEMHSAIRTARMVARMTGLPWVDIRDRKLSKDQWPKVLRALQSLPAEYERIEGQNVEWIARHIRRHRWDLAVVDTATRIPARDTQEVAWVSGTLADVAREVNCHLIEVLQLNLERCKTANRPSPTGRDLLGGGAWFRDARNVMFIHRKQMSVGEERVKVMLDGHVNCDKATHGEPENGYVPVMFNPKWMRFDEDEAREFTQVGSQSSSGVTTEKSAANSGNADIPF